MQRLTRRRAADDTKGKYTMNRMLFFGLMGVLAGVLVLAGIYLLPALAEAASPKAPVAPVAPVARADGLVITDVKVGKGRVAAAGQHVIVNYTGWLYDPKAVLSHGPKFDSSIGRGPFDFDLG